MSRRLPECHPAQAWASCAQVQQSAQVEREINPRSSEPPTREQFEDRLSSSGPPVHPFSLPQPAQKTRFGLPEFPPSTHPATREQNIQPTQQSAGINTIAEEIAIQLQTALRPLVGAIGVLQRDNVRNRRQDTIAGNAHPPIHSSHDIPVPSTHDWRSNDQSLKANKAFKLILAAKAEQFDGSDRGQYRDWKESLEREVYGLNLTPAQWMDLLHARTTKDANAAIQPARLLQRETSPGEALGIAWRFLDQQFSTSQKPSQQLLDELLRGQTITGSNPTSLTDFPTNAKQLYC